MSDGKHMKRRKGRRTKQYGWDEEQEKYFMAIMALDDATIETAREAMNARFNVNRSWQAYYVKHGKLTGRIKKSENKIKNAPTNNKRTWTGYHEAFVLNNYGIMTTSEIAKKLGRTENAIQDRYNLLMRIKGTSVVFRDNKGRENIILADELEVKDAPEVIHKEVHQYPEFIPKRWIIKEIKSQYRTRIRQEKAKAKKQINDLRKEMKEEIRRIKNDE
tara:strand:- start:334 stop:987 length:654 start_codon:yes stop_codon:yes gene_type:complete